MNKTLLLLAIILIISITECLINPQKYSNCKKITKDDRYAFVYWDISDWSENGTIHLGIETNIDGWLGMGISNGSGQPTQIMSNNGQGSDIWVLTVSQSSDTDICFDGCFKDYWTTIAATPGMDSSQDWVKEAVTWNGSLLSGEASRLLNTNDPNDHVFFRGLVNMIFAGVPAPTRAQNGVPVNHGTLYGTFSIDFSKNSTCTPPPPDVPTQFVSPDGVYKVTWLVSDDKMYIKFIIVAKTTGWVGVGINKLPIMASHSDLYVGWVNADGSVVLVDSYADDRIQPIPDTQQDAINITGSEDNGVTTISFSRLLVSTDKTNDIDITNIKQYLLWSYSTVDGTGTGSSVSYSQHIDRGTFNVNFLDSGLTPTPSPTPSPPSPNNTNDSKKTEYKSPNGIYQVEWKLSDDNLSLNFTMRAKVTGYVAVGFHKAIASMVQNADIYVGWVNDDGTVVVVDTISNDYVQPVTDNTQDAMNVTGSVVNGVTTISFVRKVDTKDPQDVVIQNNTQFVLYSYSSIKGIGTLTSSIIFVKHDDKGTFNVNLLARDAIITDVNSNTSNFKASYVLLIIIGGIFSIWIVIRFFKKSFKFVAYGPDRDLEQGEDFTIPKKKGFGETFRGVLGHRIPFQWEVIDIFIIIGYVVVNIISVFIALGAQKTTADVLSFGKGLGALLCVNAVFVALPATRNSLLVVFLGIPFDRTIKYHRMLGYWVFTLIILHFSLMTTSFTKEPQSTPNVTISKIFSGTVLPGTTVKPLFGTLAFISVIIMVGTSLEPIRRKYFEVFMTSHYFFFLFFIFASLHVPDFIPYALTAAGLFGLDMIFRLAQGSFPRKTTLLEPKPGGITRVRFPKSTIIMNMKGGYRVGQYVFLNFPGINIFEWHPFSITSAPKDPEVEVNIRALGNYTEQLSQLAQQNQNIYVRCEGPYGNLNLNYRRYPVMLLVAGGIGITPVMGILRDCYGRSKKRALRKVFLIWSIPAEDNFGWFADDFRGFVQAGAPGGHFPELELRVHCSRSQNALAPPLYNGRPNIKDTLNKISADHPDLACFVFVCGPGPMVDDCWDNVNKQRRKGRPFHYHHEIFEF